MPNLQVVMPMAGRGERFRKYGYSTPKPVLKYQGKRFFARALSSLRPLIEDKDHGASVLFVVSDEDQIQDIVKSEAENIFHDLSFDIINLSKRTRGPLDTLIQTESTLNLQGSLLMLDCDLEFTSKDYMDCVKGLIQGHRSEDGALVTFPSRSPQYSYVTDRYQTARRVVEKRVISNQALAGSYFFRQGQNAMDHAKSIVGVGDDHKEYFASDLIQLLISRGQRFHVSPTDSFLSFGTPKELLEAHV